MGSENPNYGTYHPHFHVLLCVPTSYFKKKNYPPDDPRGSRKEY
ncbi:protein rep [Halobacillus halophilus]|nr:protein rep [Halobacillus halophilus]